MSQTKGGSGRVSEILQDGTRRTAGGRLRDLVREWAKSIVVALLLFLVIRTAVVEAFKIPTSSMEGTLLVGDFLLVNKAVYGARIPGTDWTLVPFAEPRRGEVIVFHPPHEPDKNYVKRLVGVPFDTLQMVDKKLYVNGTPAYEPYAQYVDHRGDAVHPDMGWQSNHLIAAEPRPTPNRRDRSCCRRLDRSVERRSASVLGRTRDRSRSCYRGSSDRRSPGHTSVQFYHDFREEH